MIDAITWFALGSWALTSVALTTGWLVLAMRPTHHPQRTEAHAVRGG